MYNNINSKTTQYIYDKTKFNVSIIIIFYFFVHIYETFYHVWCRCMYNLSQNNSKAVFNIPGVGMKIHGKKYNIHV